MNFGRLLPLLLSLLVIVVHLHCICGHGEAAGSAPAHHCHDESACLCKGATLAQPLDVVVPSLAWDQLLCELELQSSVMAAPAQAPRVMTSYSLPTPPPSGRILRAHLSSLVI